jgi:transcriptional regulator with XRE-family HTH domain
LDIHPDDLAARLELRAELVGLRRHAALSQRELAEALGVHPGTVSHFEVQTAANSLTTTFARYAAKFGRELRIVPVGVSVETATSRNLAAMAAGESDLVQAHRYDIARIAEEMVACRLSRRVLARDVGARMGRNDSAISNIERGTRSEQQLSSWQRYARALGGRLDVSLVSLVPSEGAA